MQVSRTSKHYFRFSCQEVYDAVNEGSQSEGISVVPVEEEEANREAAIRDGKMYAKITDRTPGKSCGYILYASKFDVHWNAVFEEVQGECQMTMTETYEFHKGAFIQYLSAKLFLRQKQQHDLFFKEIRDRLRLKEFRSNSSRDLSQL